MINGSSVRAIGKGASPKMSDGFHIPIGAARARLLLGPENPQFITLRERGSLTVELYRPLEIDHQQPHSRDECYVIVEGRGFFQDGR